MAIVKYTMTIVLFTMQMYCILYNYNVYYGKKEQVGTEECQNVDEFGTKRNTNHT